MYRQRPSPLPYNSSLCLGNSALRDKFHAGLCPKILKFPAMLALTLNHGLWVMRYPRYTMAFFKSFFGNSADMQDESFALESLEGSSPTTDSTRAGSTLMTVANPTSMNADTTPAPMVLPDTTLMDANTTPAPVVSPDTTLMDANTTPTPALSADAPPAATPTNAILINADTTPIPAISTDTTSMDADTTPMDADTTPTPDDNTPGSYPVLSLPKEVTPGGATGGGESTMVIYKRSSVAENSSAVLPPSKVHLREVDHSSTLHTQVYGLKKSLYHKNADFNNLEAQIRGKDAVIAEQAQLLSQLSQGLKEVKQQTAAQSSALAQVGLKDAIIVQQSDALQRLQRDLDEVRNHAVVEAKAEIQRLQVDRESEILALNQKYEMTLHKLEEEEEDQERSEMPAPKPPAPALNLSDDVPHETDAAPPQTHSWMPSRRGQGKKVQKEPETHEQRLRNLAYVRDLFKAAFTVTQDEEFLRCGGVSDQKWTVETRSDQYWITKITQKFVRIKRHVDRAKPRVRDNLSVETSAEVAARLANVKDETLKKARRDMQRRTKIF
ncbi:hypothetical protein EDD16DRAFT_1516159 [Pisolithus croceorrhizus]|nr:hypothetical protein EDD16DRAFT_1516159 [Pisolithus croceorrhizus]